MSEDAETLLNHLKKLNLLGGDYVSIGTLLFLFDDDEDRTLAAMLELAKAGLGAVSMKLNGIMLSSGFENSN